MAADYYLQLDGIKGESTDSKHQAWIECTMGALGNQAAQKCHCIDWRRAYRGAR